MNPEHSIQHPFDLLVDRCWLYEAGQPIIAVEGDDLRTLGNAASPTAGTRNIDQIGAQCRRGHRLNRLHPLHYNQMQLTVLTIINWKC